jgi:glyoxalase family protein
MTNKDNYTKILGLHHVTALSSDVQKNVDFYAGILGLRMVKKTVNFDAPDVYHLYYGDREGSPGTLMTFFPYPGMVMGRKGTGQMTVTSFSIPEGSMGYWMKRLDKFRVDYTRPQTRFENEEFIYFEDNDGLGIELVANDRDFRDGYNCGHIPTAHTIKGFYGVTLNQQRHERTADFLADRIDHELIAEEKGRFRFSVDGEVGKIVDVLALPSGTIGSGGSGTVHHVAFATINDDTQLEVRERLVSAGVHVTPVVDRQYFRSIYFREPGGVLFEVATNPPGMAIDEDPKHLGEELKLPPWQEKNRSAIESDLETIKFDSEKFRD